MSIKSNDRLTQTQKTLRKFLSTKERDRPIARFVDGKLLAGMASKHRTPSGVRFRRLLRLKQRFGQQA